ncbi:MAG: Uncharacterized protein YjbI [Candidatus Electronema aureum]|uniref:Uncharacterized protein YjbI n=1 Tax=Candidatus Electronema aureum TaxID=2005002 RepID=A0A521G3E3_9BACT|nr:MAG: Uncharacterized protein YjbI [Candidatus Electronema aureum]
MANKEQLAILKQGVAAWNKWREENPDAKINLRGAKLDGLDLSGANFSKADIRGTNFNNTLLIMTNFSSSKLDLSFIGKALYVLLSSAVSIRNVVISLSFIFLFSFFAILISGLKLLPSSIDIIMISIITIIITVSLIIVITNFLYYFFHIDVLFSKEQDGKDYYLSTSFKDSDLTWAVFDKANIVFTNFSRAILTGVSFRKIVKLTKGVESKNNFEDTVISDHDVRELLIYSNAAGFFLKEKNLRGFNLVEFIIRNTDLRGTDLRQANLSRADITGAKLYNSARENWIIDDIHCDYVYWDEAGEQRTPPDRDFRPGEFEELYKQLPTFEYIFEQGFTPLDPLIMDRVVQAVNKRHKEFSLELVSFDKRGQPHATFTVCHLEHVEKAKQQIAAGYEESRIAPDQQAQLMAAVLGLIENQNKLIDKIPSSRGLEMGDTYNIHGGQIGAVGQSASASGNTFQQIIADLSRLHEEMQRSAKTPEQRAAADEVAKAEQAARQKNEPAMQRHLKNVGKFALACAKSIGTEALSEYLKKITLGI